MRSCLTSPHSKQFNVQRCYRGIDGFLLRWLTYYLTNMFIKTFRTAHHQQGRQRATDDRMARSCLPSSMPSPSGLCHSMQHACIVITDLHKLTLLPPSYRGDMWDWIGNKPRVSLSIPSDTVARQYGVASGTTAGYLSFILVK